ncbi:unnamed protein product [Bodo saltans]|uniref:Uncharacterized protein n=1 Tax=Bodo saltans TaxID=75058 RepID=A0A0S4J3F1_BODSA|nr:unnamed protein product [Bodo saltans]|eukprot:CUG85670.1 unnamed protein product [Bodo saltans]
MTLFLAGNDLVLLHQEYQKIKNKAHHKQSTTINPNMPGQNNNEDYVAPRDKAEDARLLILLRVVLARPVLFSRGSVVPFGSRQAVLTHTFQKKKQRDKRIAQDSVKKATGRIQCYSEAGQLTL